jgi:TPR repeat protein
MKAYLACLALALSASVMADELTDANKLLENKAYPQALALYGKLANNGNAEAQFHLGEMYWYGEAGQIDLAIAERWFRQAAAGGSREAAAALALMRQRAERKDEIALWTGGYDGADLKSGEFSCPPPAIPAISKTNEEVKQVEQSHAAWQTCYNGMVENLNKLLPTGKRIPADIAAMMNQTEYDRAIAHLAMLYSSLADEATSSATAVDASYSGWHRSTAEYAEARKREMQAQAELDLRMIQQANSRIGIATPKQAISNK